MRTAQYTLLDSCTISIEAAESKHPNEMKFSGVLVRVDEASTKAPNGSRGHRILLPSSLAKKQLHTLIGMGVNYSSDMKSHAPTRKVGVIQKAWLDGKDLKISGIIWKKDFPDAVDDLSAKNLGMSFEASEISVEDEKADIWVLTSLCFTGATILYKTSAAYYKTSADAMAASAEVLLPARLIKIARRRKFMANTKKKIRPGKRTVTAGADTNNEALLKAFTRALAPVVTQLGVIAKGQVSLQASIDSLEASEDENEEEDVDLEAGGDDDDDDDIEAGEEDESMTSKKVKAAKKKKGSDDDDDDAGDDDDDDDDIDSEADDEGSLDDLGEDDSDVEESGKMNKDARTNKGRSVASKPAGKGMSSSATRAIAKLTASNEEQAEEIQRLRTIAQRQKKSLAAAADRTERKSVSVSTILASTLGKANVDLQAMSDAGEKLTIAEFDIAAANCNIDPVTSMAMKNELTRNGLMETGEVKARTIR